MVILMYLNSNRLILTFLFRTNLSTSFSYRKAKAEFKKSVATINTVNYQIQPNSNTAIVNDNDQYNYLDHVIVIFMNTSHRSRHKENGQKSYIVTTLLSKENSSSSSNAFHSVNYSCTEIKTKQKLHTS